MMTTTWTRHVIRWLLPSALIIALGIGLAGCTERSEVPPATRADLILIDSLSAFGALDRPPVAFLHDQHTEALADQDDACETCHVSLEDGRLSQLFKRIEDDGKEIVMQLGEFRVRGNVRLDEYQVFLRIQSRRDILGGEGIQAVGSGRFT